MSVGRDPQTVARLWEHCNSMQDLADRLGCTLRAAFACRARAERELGITLPAKNNRGVARGYTRPAGPQIFNLESDKPLTMIVLSDIHTWGLEPPAYHIAKQVIKDAKPDLLILNGDVMDLPNVSKFKPHTLRELQQRPKIEQEIAATQMRLKELHEASPKSRRMWLLGNHCVRFERYVILNAPELAGVKGAALEDHFPGWEIGGAMFINDILAIKHTIKGSIHAAYHNTQKAGISTITGHTHRLTCRAVTDYRGIRWGCEGGFIGAINDESGVWNYVDANPVDWQPGFLAAYLDGDYLQAEPVHVLGDRARFHGKDYRVEPLRKRKAA